MDSPDGLNVLRHSTAHVLAQAVQDVFPEAKLGIGPPIENGFYYDFAVAKPFQPDDLPKIEKRMQEIIKAGQRFRRRRFDSLERGEDRAGRRAVQARTGRRQGPDVDATEVMEVGGGELTIYDNVDADHRQGLLVRPVSRPAPADDAPDRRVQADAHGRRLLARVEKNPQLQRVYGTAWPTRDALKDYLKLLEEAARRDHRKLGSDLDLFSFPDEIGSGLAVFHPKGGIIRRELENYSRLKHEAAGYSFVNTPHITKGQLFETSGHLQWYADGMYPPMQLEGANYYLKPMNCPFHNLIFQARGRSYRELPLRLFEFGTVYRFEKSGVIHGLTRVRGMTQDDAHIYCTREQMGGELKSLLTFVLDLLRDYGLDDFYLELSTRNPEKSVGTDEAWEEATEALRSAATESGLELVPDPGGAAFYGPKISVQAKDAIGRTWQMSTIQVDFNLPERFELEFQGSAGARERPVMIHRALFGSIERFFGVLTEHYAGAFPAWLAPVQVVGIPIRDDHADYLADFVALLRAAGHPGRGRLLRRPHAEEDPHRAAAEDPVHGDRRRRGRGRWHGVVPLPRRLAAQQHATRRGGRARGRDRPVADECGPVGAVVFAAVDFSLVNKSVPSPA